MNDRRDVDLVEETMQRYLCHVIDAMMNVFGECLVAGRGTARRNWYCDAVPGG
jgi:hypothetical protein